MGAHRGEPQVEGATVGMGAGGQGSTVNADEADTLAQCEGGTMGAFSKGLEAASEAGHVGGATLPLEGES